MLANLDESPGTKAARLMTKFQKPAPEISVYRLTGPQDKTLLFESRFECGNLYLAQKATDLEYNLLM
jgi:hypothetical protein